MKVLLVGNSYLYYNNLVHQLLHMKPEDGKNVEDEIKQKDDKEALKLASAFVAAFTVRMNMLVEGGKGLVELQNDFPGILEAFDPDIVVLQDQSSNPAKYHTSDKNVGDRYNETIEVLKNVYKPALKKWGERSKNDKTRNKRVIFYATSVRSDKMFKRREFYLIGETAPFNSEAEMLEKLEAGYTEYANIVADNENNEELYTTCLAPVGRVLHEVRKIILSGAVGAFRLENSGAGGAGKRDSQRSESKESVESMTSNNNSGSTANNSNSMPSKKILTKAAEAFYMENDKFAHPSPQLTALIAMVFTKVFNDGKNVAKPSWNRLFIDPNIELLEFLRGFVNANTEFCGKFEVNGQRSGLKICNVGKTQSAL